MMNLANANFWTDDQIAPKCLRTMPREEKAARQKRMARKREETTDFLAITFDQLKWKNGNPSNCRFPSSESPPSAPFTYCGQPVVLGLSYCARCSAVVHQPPRSPNRVHGRGAV